MLLFQIKSQPVNVYKNVAYKKTCNIVLQPSKCEESTFPHPFIFVLIPYSIGAIKSREMLPKVGRGKGKRYKGCGEEKYIKEGWPYTERGGSYLLHTMIKCRFWTQIDWAIDQFQ